MICWQVASLLSDNSIGRKINVSLIALIQLQDDEVSTISKLFKIHY